MAYRKVKHVNKTTLNGRTYVYHRLTGEKLSDVPEEAIRQADAIDRLAAPPGQVGVAKLEAHRKWTKLLDLRWQTA